YLNSNKKAGAEQNLFWPRLFGEVFAKAGDYICFLVEIKGPAEVLRGIINIFFGGERGWGGIDISATIAAAIIAGSITTITGAVAAGIVRGWCRKARTVGDLQRDLGAIGKPIATGQGTNYGAGCLGVRDGDNTYLVPFAFQALTR